jgi:hypothetical protein
VPLGPPRLLVPSFPVASKTLPEDCRLRFTVTASWPGTVKSLRRPASANGGRSEQLAASRMAAARVAVAATFHAATKKLSVTMAPTGAYMRPAPPLSLPLTYFKLVEQGPV